MLRKKSTPSQTRRRQCNRRRGYRRHASGLPSSSSGRVLTIFAAGILLPRTAILPSSSPANARRSILYVWIPYRHDYSLVVLHNIRAWLFIVLHHNPSSNLQPPIGPWLFVVLHNIRECTPYETDKNGRQKIEWNIFDRRDWIQLTMTRTKGEDTAK